MTYSTYRKREEFLSLLQTSNEKILYNLDKIKVALSEQGFAYQKDSYHLIEKLLKFNNRFEKIFHGIVHDACFKAEILSSSGGYVALRFGTQFIKNFLKYEPDWLTTNEVTLLDEFNKTILKYQKLIQESTKQANKDLLTKAINKVCDQDNLLALVIEQAMLVSGLEGKIRLEPGTQLNYVVELKSGYSFKLYPYKFFLTQTPEMWYANNVKVLIIDGVIEKISELDKILNKSMETKQPLVIIGRGFSEEVIATLKANNDYGNFNILPVKLGIDLESINIANDIAAVVGSDIVSTLKGDMIYFIDYDNIPTVEFVRATSAEVSIENGCTRASVSRQIKSLLEKRYDQHVIEDIGVLIDERIKSLISNTVIIKFPNATENKKEEIRVKIDLALRAAKSLLNNGYVLPVEIYKNFVPETKMDKIFKLSLELITNELDWCPSLSAFVGPKIIGQALLSVLSSNGLVEKI